MKNRLNYVDMVKGIATIEVVLYHLLAPGAFRSSVIDPLLAPLLIAFFFFSGFFYKPGKRSLGENIRNRAESLLIPFVKYGGIFWFIGSVYLVLAKQETVMEAFCCLRNFFAGCIWNRVIQGWFNWQYYKLGSRYMFLAGFWFLPALFFACLIFFPVADRVLDSKGKTGAAVILLFAVTGILRGFKVDLPYNLQIVPFWAAFMLLGAFAGQLKLFELPSMTGTKGWAASVLSLAAGIVISILLGPVTSMFRGNYPEPEIRSMILCILAAILFIWGLGALCRLIEESGMRVKEISWIGSHSMEIYLFHFFFAWIISIITGFSLRYADPSPADIVWKSAAVAACAFTLCILRAILLDKIKEGKQ